METPHSQSFLAPNKQSVTYAASLWILIGVAFPPPQIYRGKTEQMLKFVHSQDSL